MSDLLIRHARVAEQKELEALQLRASLTNAGDREALLEHPDAIEVPIDQIKAGAVIVCERNEVTAGFAAALPRQDGNFELDALFVDLEMRRQGIARLLVEHCAGMARRRGAPALCVIGNPHAAEFYQACDFEKIGATETRFGPGLLLKKML